MRACGTRRRIWPYPLLTRACALKPSGASIRAIVLILRHRRFKIVLGGMQLREFRRAIIAAFAVGHAASVLTQRTGNVAPGRIVVVERISAFIGVASRCAAAQHQENAASHDSRRNAHFRPPTSQSPIRIQPVQFLGPCLTGKLWGLRPGISTVLPRTRRARRNTSHAARSPPNCKLVRNLVDCTQKRRPLGFRYSLRWPRLSSMAKRFSLAFEPNFCVTWPSFLTMT